MSSPHLPAELLDHIADLLQDTRDTLKSCCLVSKSWIPRTRKHLFADVAFNSPEKLQLWKNAFPDLSTSPARYTRSLSISYPALGVTTTDAQDGGWIPTFSRVVHLEVDTWTTAVNDLVCLIPLHGFSPVVKSIHIVFTSNHSSHIFDLICSFPSLEDLSAIGNDAFDIGSDGPEGQPTFAQPLSRPALTGSLELSVGTGMDPFLSRLLTLQGGLRFRKLQLICHRPRDISLATALVEGCCATLEDLIVGWLLLRTSVLCLPLHLAPLTSVCR